MLNNLFSSFDVKNFFFFMIFIMNIYFFIFLSLLKKMMMLKYFLKKYFLFIFTNINKKYFFFMMFTFVLLMNFMSLNFYSFNLTSQISMNLYMIMILWLPMLLISLTKMNNSFLIHILPLGTTGLLIPMMILIEILSFMIRPLTLILRLTINMIAGHVLIHLINSTVLNNNMLYFYMVIYLYMLMKFLVSFIQSYIITTLLNLYIEEI